MTPWNENDKIEWLKQQTIKRSYQQEVLNKLDGISSNFEVLKYGSLGIDPQKYPLFIILNQNYDLQKKTVLITGGVHGYETSGVQGAIRFMLEEAESYKKFNFICAPCISPWGYETVNRWNHQAIDPNRSFREGSEVEECSLFMKAIKPYMKDIFMHIDLHETTDTDNSVFRPAKAARDGVEEEFSEIPDGFYTVGDSENPVPDFQKAIIDSVRKITHIAPPDEKGNIIGAPLEQEGVINYPLKKLSLCAGVTNAKFTTTTEVYPDSPKVNDEICTQAQVAAIKGALDYLNNK